MRAARARRRWLATMVAALSLIASAFATAGVAEAHASLLASEPAEGAVVAGRPGAFRLTFNEPISPLALKLAVPDGSVVDLAEPTVEGPTLVAPAPRQMPPGTYLLSWRVVSLDGHPVGGTITFSLGHPSAAPSPVLATTMDWPLGIAIWTVKVLLYLCLFLGVGGALYASVIAPLPAKARALAFVLAPAGLVAAGVSVGLQGLDAVDAPLVSLFHAPVWQVGFSTTYCATAAFAAASLVLATAALLLNARHGASLLAFTATAGVGLALCASGHASTAPPQWLARPSVFLHAVALTFWIGSLPPLALALRLGGEGAAQALARFSRLIPYAVAPLILTGLVLAAIQLGSLSALFDAAYGRVLLAKLLLVGGLFGLAAWNRWRLTTPAARGDRNALRNLRRSIAAEMVVVVAILGVVALWRFTPPPRALVVAVAPSVEVHLHGEKAMAQLSIAPGRVGTAIATIEIFSENGPIDPKEVTLVVRKADSGLEAITRTAHRMGDGTWRVDALTLPLAGKWTARVEILVSDFEEVRLEAPVEIAP